MTKVLNNEAYKLEFPQEVRARIVFHVTTLKEVLGRGDSLVCADRLLPLGLVHEHST